MTVDRIDLRAFQFRRDGEDVASTQVPLACEFLQVPEQYCEFSDLVSSREIRGEPLLGLTESEQHRVLLFFHSHFEPECTEFAVLRREPRCEAQIDIGGFVFKLDESLVNIIRTVLHRHVYLPGLRTTSDQNSSGPSLQECSNAAGIIQRRRCLSANRFDLSAVPKRMFYSPLNDIANGLNRSATVLAGRFSGGKQRGAFRTFKSGCAEIVGVDQFPHTVGVQGFQSVT